VIQMPWTVHRGAASRRLIRRRLLFLLVFALTVAFVAISFVLLRVVKEETRELRRQVERLVLLSDLREHFLGFAALTIRPPDPGTVEGFVADVDRKLVQLEVVGAFHEDSAAVLALIRDLRDALVANFQGGGDDVVVQRILLDVERHLDRASLPIREFLVAASNELDDCWEQLQLILFVSGFFAVFVSVILLVVAHQDDVRRALERELLSTIERAPIGIALVDARSVVRLVNHALCELLRRSADEIVDAPLGTFVIETAGRHGSAQLGATFAALAEDRTPIANFGLSLRRSDGERVETICHVRETESVLAREKLFAVHLEDVTERRRMLQNLAEYNDTLDTLLEASRDGLVLVDPSFRVAYANRSFTDLFGFDVDSVVGGEASAVVALAAGHPPEVRAALRRLLLEGEDLREPLLPFRCVVRTPRARTLLLSAVPVSAGDGKFLGRLALARDVTQEESSRRAKDQFLGNVSHELRSPLTSIGGFVDLLRTDRLGELNERQKDVLRIVADNVTRLTALVADLLAVGHLDERRPKFAPLDLSRLLADAVALAGPTAAGKGIALRATIPPAVVIEGDAGRISELVTNLLSNAIKYTDRGGVEVVAAVDDRGFATIEVIDTGIGIDAADFPRLFDRFFRAENPATRKVRGTGLGLSIARTVAEQHGGRIEVESTRDVGSTFRVLLPLRRGGILPPATRGVESLPAPQRGVRARKVILAIDDDVVSRRIVKQALATCGLDVVSAETAASGLDAAMSCDPDLVLVDLELPDSDGVELIERLRKLPGLAGVPILALSSAAAPPSLAALPHVSHLAKPVPTARLREEVVRRIDDGTIVCDALEPAG
jgi:PAS domain S-box-containing protein